MKYIVITGVVVSFGILQLKAQTDFRKGYIVKNDNDTIYGLIDYRGNKANAKKCTFRKDINSEKQVFYPTEIKGFRFIDSKYYVSRIINVGDKNEQLFLEYLINGIVDIYYYRDDDLGDHYLVENEKGDLFELKNEEKEVIRNNTRYIMSSKEYIGLLKNVFRESPSISKKAENVYLTHKSLVGIAHDYHNEVCSTEECIIYEKKIPKLKCTFGILTGLNFISFTQPERYPVYLYYLENSELSLHIVPSIGLYYKINIPRLNEKIYLQHEITFSRIQITTTNLYVEPVYKMKLKNDITLKQDIISNLIVVKYEFPKGKIRPTFQFGGLINYYFNADYNRDVEVRYSSGDIYDTDHFNDSPFRRHNFGINCGIGLKSIYLNNKEVHLDFKYQRGYGILQEVPENNINTNNLSINLGFQIGK